MKHLISLLFLALVGALLCAQTAGGPTAVPSITYGSNLLLNPGMETPSNGDPESWGDNGFERVTDVYRSGTASYRLQDAHLIPYTQSASQTISLTKGVYRASIWVKLDGVAATVGGGVRLILDAGANGYSATAVVKGTSDWQQLIIPKLNISGSGSASFKLNGYADPDGTAWFDDAELVRERHEIISSCRYPNYRGMLWSDYSQVTTWTLGVEPPSGVIGDYRVEYTVTDEGTEQVMAHEHLTAATSMAPTIDFTSFSPGPNFLVKWELVQISTEEVVGTYPDYRIIKAAASARAAWTVSAAPDNRILFRDTPTFILGVYDSGLGYTTTKSAWEDALTEKRRLFELPINFYLNYWYGEIGNSAAIPLMDCLGDHGIMFLQTHNGFAAGCPWDGMWWPLASDADRATRAAHSQFLGVYVADESTDSAQTCIMPWSLQNIEWDPDGINFGAMFGNASLSLWRDTLDWVFVDPYPLYGTEPPGGYNLSQVAAWVKIARNSLQDSRPVGAVIQFFQTTTSSRWPTQAELRNMSYMAIAEGANGVVYWSLGAKGLSYACDGSTEDKSPAGTTSWCPFRVAQFTNLKNVMLEMDAIKTTLAGVDRNDKLTGNSNTNIHTRVKQAPDGSAYIIASNNLGTVQSATFTWSGTPVVSVYAESRNIEPVGAAFTDSFDPYEAHVYHITEGPPPPPSGSTKKRTARGKVIFKGAVK